ncbi:MAG: trypsin-like peptidase domain-containing protein [Firmicutes bacterium]|nr:trypsin-like peptidase domain-containing protein [Bacillota bacterium]
MKKPYGSPPAKIIAAFLAGMLIVAAVFIATGTGGLKHLWADEQVAGQAAAAPLPGLGPDTIPDIVSNTSPAVVRIDTATERQSSIRTDPFFNDPFFRQFFGDQFRFQTEPEISRGMGSGFIVSKDGYILTNEHVISGADRVEVTVTGREKPYPATKVGADHDLDLAVLKIEAEGDLPTLPLGNSDAIRVGDWVIAIGNPYGLDHTVTVGVISAKGRPVSVQDRQYKNLLQTDASINPGNSGGPLLNLKGEVVGINTAINAQAQGIGFAIPSSTVQAVFDDLVKKGGVDHPWLGVYLQGLTKDAAQYLGLEGTDGALVASVVPGSPADKAGLKRGDVIVSYNGVEIKTPGDLTGQVQNTAIGSRVEMKVIRKGNTLSLTPAITAKKSQ